VAAARKGTDGSTTSSFIIAIMVWPSSQGNEPTLSLGLRQKMSAQENSHEHCRDDQKESGRTG
jgi:hypothetical protein